MALKTITHCSFSPQSHMIFIFFIYLFHLHFSSSNTSTNLVIKPRILSPVLLGTPINFTVQIDPSNPETTFQLVDHFYLKVNHEEWMVHQPYTNQGRVNDPARVRILQNSNKEFTFQITTTDNMHGYSLSIEHEAELLDLTNIYQAVIQLIWPPAPLKLDFDPPEGVLKEGDQLKVSCNAPFLGLPPQKLHFNLDNANLISKTDIKGDESSSPRSMRMDRVYQVSWRTHQSRLLCHLDTERAEKIISVRYAPKNITIHASENAHIQGKGDSSFQKIELYSKSYVRCSSNGHPEPHVLWNLDPNQGVLELRFAREMINVSNNELRLKESSSKLLEDYAAASKQTFRELRFLAKCQALNEISPVPLEKKYMFIVKDADDTKGARMSVIMISMLSVILFCVALAIVLICWKRQQKRRTLSQSKVPGPDVTYAKVDEKNSLPSSEVPLPKSKRSPPYYNNEPVTYRDQYLHSKSSPPVNPPDLVCGAPFREMKSMYQPASTPPFSRQQAAHPQTFYHSQMPPTNECDYVNFAVSNGFPQAMYDSQGRPIPTEV